MSLINFSIKSSYSIMVKIVKFKYSKRLAKRMVKISRPVAIGGGLAALVAAAAYTGLPPPDGWFFKAADWAFNAVKYAAPEGSDLRQFIDQHPAYTAGLEGLVVGGVVGAAFGAAAIFFAMKRYYSNRVKNNDKN